MLNEGIATGVILVALACGLLALGQILNRFSSRPKVKSQGELEDSRNRAINLAIENPSLDNVADMWDRIDELDKYYKSNRY